MACIEARCPKCNDIVFSNSAPNICVCQKCGSFMFLQYDKFKPLNVPDSVKRAEFKKYLKTEKKKYKK